MQQTVVENAAIASGVARILHWGPQKLSAEDAGIEAPKAPRGVGIGEGPQPTREPGGVVSSPSAVRGGAPAANAFLAYLRSTEHFC